MLQMFPRCEALKARALQQQAERVRKEADKSLQQGTEWYQKPFKTFFADYTFKQLTGF